MSTPLTNSQLLFRLQDFYGAEQDALKIGDYEFAQECSDIVSVISELQVFRKANSELPPLIMQEECPAEIRELMASHSDALFDDEDAQEIWNACRAAMLLSISQTENGK